MIPTKERTPMFKGEKVILRPTEEEDIPRLYEFAQDPELAGLDCGYPYAASIERVRGRFEKFSKEEDERKSFFAIEADGKYIGDCCLMGLKDMNGNAELGIVIGDRAYWGRGYGRDAIRLLLHYGFHYFGLRRIVLTTHARNLRAIRCYLACGFVEEGRPRKVLWFEGEYVDLVNMSILREEWLAICVR
jgi:RimJ/RimL family protein N-acetyltransferase